MSLTPSQIHTGISNSVQFFARSVRAGDAPVAAHWLNQYHDFWDAYETLGGKLQINLPANGIRWNEHNGEDR